MKTHEPFEVNFPQFLLSQFYCLAGIASSGYLPSTANGEKMTERKKDHRAFEHAANVVGGSVTLGVVGLAVAGPVAGIALAVVVPLADFVLKKVAGAPRKMPLANGPKSSRNSH